jgi:hypothetical protein
LGWRQVREQLRHTASVCVVWAVNSGSNQSAWCVAHAWCPGVCRPPNHPRT